MTVRVAILWHMHQPSYRDPMDDRFILPWVRLHALKDYLGMVEVLEETPDVHLTFNLVPSLLDQLEAYVSGVSRDPLHALSRPSPDALSLEDRLTALRGFFMAHPQNLIGRFPRFLELLEKRGPRADEAALREADSRFTVEDYRDLQVLANLAWFDRGWQVRDATLKTLAAKGRGYTEEDKLGLWEREAALLRAVLPAYRRARQNAQVELSTSPYYHPILPLLCDTDAHLEAHPGAPLPKRFRHPEDAADQIARALVRHESLFGERPQGLWPSEGSVSEQTVLEIAKAGLRWTASDEGVLERSAGHPIHRDSRGTAYPLELLYRPWIRRTEAGPVGVFFRDRSLSDLVGFSYSAFDPELAAKDLLERLLRVGERWEGIPGDPVVPIILDGENAWEHFPDGGRTFLRSLYKGLGENPRLEAVTMSEALQGTAPRELPRIFAGSWINADFSVWIGHADDRKAWDLLGEAREALVAFGPAKPLEVRERAWEHYRTAAGSDWCWWYGDDHSSENDIEFDRLFRRNLRSIYLALDLTPPEVLDETLITSRKLEVRQSQPAGRLVVRIDGEISSAEEWFAAGVYRVPLGGSMHRGVEKVRQIRFGRGGNDVFVLVEMSEPAGQALRGRTMDVSFPGPTTVRYRVDDSGLTRQERSRMGWLNTPTRARAAVGAVVEVGIPLAELRPGPGQIVEFRVLLSEGATEFERQPDVGPLSLALDQAES